MKTFWEKYENILREIWICDKTSVGLECMQQWPAHSPPFPCLLSRSFFNLLSDQIYCYCYCCCCCCCYMIEIECCCVQGVSLTTSILHVHQFKLWLYFVYCKLQKDCGFVSSHCLIIVSLYSKRAWRVNSVTFDTGTLFRVHEQRLASLFALLSSDLEFVFTNKQIRIQKSTNINSPNKYKIHLYTNTQIHKY